MAAGVPIIASTGNQFGLIGRALSDASGAQFGQVCPQQFLSPGVAPGQPHCPNNLQGVVQALDQVGLMHTLAEPNLTAVSGETARFLAGGEFPVPSGRDQQGNVSISFKQFGVGLSFTPVVLSENRISLQISTEVSELTNTGAFTLAATTSVDPTTGQTLTAPGLTIPALNVRRAQTTIELPSGGSFAIAGLLQQTNKQVIDEFPGLANMPVLGALFRSRDYQNNETELVVLVSAYLVRPTSEKRLSAPTDSFVPPSDLDTILSGRLNVQHPPVADSLKSAANTANGFIVQ
jgi:pilus assembly protein CpaC